MSKNIAVFHKSIGTSEIMKSLFWGEGLHVLKASTLNELLSLIECENIHLILVVLELEGRGLDYDTEIIRHIRKCTVIPMIVISSQTAESAQIMSLNVGADDYVTVHDNPLVLLARIKAQLRRYTEWKTLCENIEDTYRIGNLELDDKRHTVMVSGKDVKMTPIEYKILRLLIQEQGKVLSINQIYERIWQMKAIDAENIIAVHVRHIREKIESNPKKPEYLKVVRGLGYKVG